MDVTDKKLLKSYGFTHEIYYCGNYGFQKYWTKARNLFEKHGINFPLNPACFIHDLEVATDPSFFTRLKIDFTFLKNMIIILNHKRSSSKKIREKYMYLLVRVLFYYVLVTLTTLFVSFKNVFKRRKNVQQT